MTFKELLESNRRIFHDFVVNLSNNFPLQGQHSDSVEEFVSFTKVSQNSFQKTQKVLHSLGCCIARLDHLVTQLEATEFFDTGVLLLLISQILQTESHLIERMEYQLQIQTLNSIASNAIAASRKSFRDSLEDCGPLWIAYAGVLARNGLRNRDVASKALEVALSTIIIAGKYSEIDDETDDDDGMRTISMQEKEDFDTYR